MLQCKAWMVTIGIATAQLGSAEDRSPEAIGSRANLEEQSVFCNSMKIEISAQSDFGPTLK